MTMFMANALAALPQPAALFEVPGRVFVAANDAGLALGRQLLGDGFSTAESELCVCELQDTGLCAALAEAENLDSGTYTSVEAFGTMHMTRMRAKPMHARPDLMLITVHRGVDRKTSWLDHNRIIVSLDINEASQIVTEVLQTSLQQINAALQAQYAIVEACNARMGEFLSWNDPEKIHPTGS